MNSNPVHVLVADPGWQPKDSLPKKRGAAHKYRTQTLEEIKATPLPTIADDWAVLFLWRISSMPGEAIEVMRAWGFEPKAELVWRKYKVCGKCKGKGSRMQRIYAEQIIVPESQAKTKIFTGKSLQTCSQCKGEGRIEHFGLGRYTRAAHETCLIGSRGKSVSAQRLNRDIPSVFEALMPTKPDSFRPEHSAKPDEFYEIVEKLFPGPYHEMHARRRRPGWSQEGNDLPPIAGIIGA